MTETDQSKERIDILEDILLRLHHGATPESVQEDFNQHFTGVSAIEISMMEHQLMYGDSEITFEDVLKLCNVHANLFKNAVEEGATPDADHPGHPVQVFKDENHAFRAALMRINNLLKVLGELPPEELEEGMLRGLRRQFDLLGQFDTHYERKEKLFFPLMEKYGHDAPPKVMWAKDDEIREQFKAAYKKMEQFPDIPMQEVQKAFAEFEFEFNEMIFKEEAILINILLEALSIDDWYQIARESYAYGYAIIRPAEEWVPEHMQETEVVSEPENQTTPLPAAENTLIDHPSLELNDSNIKIETRKIAVDGGFLTISWERDPTQTLADPNLLDRSCDIKIGDGYLTLDQIELVLDYLPIEITWVNEVDIVCYSNFVESWTSSPFYYRDYNSLGRSVETIYPRPLKARAMEIVEQFKVGAAERHSLVHKQDDAMIKLDLFPVHTATGEYEGYIELAHNLKYYDKINTPLKRKLTPKESYHPADINFSAVNSTPNKQAAQQNSLDKTSEQVLESHKLSFKDGDLLLTWEGKTVALEQPSDLDREVPVQLRNGSLSLKQIKRILNSVPFEISFVDHHDVFQYYNNIVDYNEMIFVRTPAQVKRDLELCHPPFLWPTISKLIQSFRDQTRFYEELWYQTPNQELIYTRYQAAYDATGNFMGMLETVLDIQPLLDLK